MKKIALAALCGVAVLGVPAAQAKPSGKGPQARDHGGERGGERGERGRSEVRSRRCAKPRRVGFVAAGSLTAHDADSVTLDVTRANRHARRYLADNDPTFDTDGVRFSFEGVTDANGDGAVDLADVVASDRVRVIGRIALPKRGCDGADPVLTLRKVVVTREVAEDEQEDAQA